MFVTPGGVEAGFDTFKQNSGVTGTAALDHLQTKQQQVWNSLAAILTFDGIMSATDAVLASGQASLLYQASGYPWSLAVSIYAFLASAVVTLIGLNMHGNYRSRPAPEKEEKIFLRTVKQAAACNGLAMTLAFVGTAFLIITLAS